MEFKVPIRSGRVTFQGGNGYELGGIIDAPFDPCLASAVFTHCFTCSKDLKAIVRISRELAEHGIAVLRYDLTGLGNSRGDFSQTNFTTNRRDLFSAIDFLSEQLQPPSVLIGHSFGGACSLSVAGEIPSIKGVVSLASPSDTHHLAQLLERMNPKIIQGSGQVTIGGKEYTITRAMLNDFREFDLHAKLQTLDKPVLLFHSPVDETLGFEQALRLYGVLGQRSSDQSNEASAVSLICLPGADHLLVRDQRDLSFVGQTSLAWIKRYCLP